MSPKGFEGETVVDERTRPNYPLFHTDAAQAALYNDLYVEKLGIDLLTLDGSKVYGPRGMGALYVRRGVPIEPIIYGGGQESGMRSGTENLPGIAGFAKALEIIEKEERQNGREGTMRKDSTIRDSKIDILRTVMIEGLKKIRPNIRINGPMEINDESRAKNIVSYSPHILNVSIPGIDNEFLVMQLDARGIACSTKSSCLRDQDESYVLRAVGANSSESVRFSFGRWTKARDVRKTLNILRKLL
jgi:cysteine desulfurase